MFDLGFLFSQEAKQPFLAVPFCVIADVEFRRLPWEWKALFSPPRPALALSPLQTYNSPH